MKDPTQPNADAIEETLDVMLALADHELRFLRGHFGAVSEIADCASGAEFLEALDVSLVALTRVRLERPHPDGPGRADTSLHDAIASMKRDGS